MPRPWKRTTCAHSHIHSMLCTSLRRPRRGSPAHVLPRAPSLLSLITALVDEISAISLAWSGLGLKHPKCSHFYGVVDQWNAVSVVLGIACRNSPTNRCSVEMELPNTVSLSTTLAPASQMHPGPFNPLNRSYLPHRSSASKTTTRRTG